MKIYIAGSFKSQSRLRPIRDKFWKTGHEVIGSWLDEGAMPEGVTPAMYDKQLATKDLAELKAADCIILDLIDPSTTGGRMVEWGYALGHAKLRYTVGENPCIFLALADIAFKTWDDLFCHFNDAHARCGYTITSINNGKYTRTIIPEMPWNALYKK